MRLGQLPCHTAIHVVMKLGRRRSICLCGRSSSRAGSVTHDRSICLSSAHNDRTDPEQVPCHLQ